MPKSVWRLMFAYALMMAGSSLMVLIGGIVGLELAPTPALATLPVALAVVGVALSTLPTGKLLARYGRHRVFVANAVLAIAAASLAAFSLSLQSFSLFCVAAVMIGWSAAAGHQYRFAALEAVPAALAPKATSVLLLGGLLGAFIGPEMAVRGRWLLGTEYAGSFVLLALSYVSGLLLISFHRDGVLKVTEHEGRGRPLLVILRTPSVVLAVGAAAMAYAMMSLIMTATPISMHQHEGHSLEATKLVIQSHIAAMYLPSIIYGALSARLGLKGMLWAGVGAYGVCLALALLDTELLHYWLALIMLGIGWNFLFLSGTNLLPLGYRPEERFRAQAGNDFLVFGVQAAVTLSSGWLLVTWHWEGLLWACVPLLLVFSVLIVWVNPAGVRTH